MIFLFENRRATHGPQARRRDAARGARSTGCYRGSGGGAGRILRCLRLGGRVAIFCGITAAPLLADEIEFRAVLMSGDEAPGSSGATFSFFHPPAINDHGEISFRASLAGEGVTSGNSIAVWVGKPDALQLAVRAGDPVPDGPGGVISTFQDHAHVMGGAGTLVERVNISGSTGIEDALIEWTAANGLRTVARRNANAPGSEWLFGSRSTSLETFQEVSVNRHGDIAFRAHGRDPDVPDFNVNASGIWHEGSDGLSLVGHFGQDAPEMSGQRWLSFLWPNLNDIDKLFFYASLSPDFNNSAIWFGLPGDPQLLYRGGDPVPGVSGRTFLTTGSLSGPLHLNQRGQVAFWGRMSGDSATNDAIFSGDPTIPPGSPGAVFVVVRKGDVVMDGDSGEVLVSGVDMSQDLTEQGAVLVRTQLAGPGSTVPGDNALWVALPPSAGATDGYELALVVREGDSAPGMGAGVVFGVGGSSTPFPRTINDAGDVVFLHRVSGPGVTSANDQGMWLWRSATRTLHLVVREGDAVEVAPGDVRTVRDLGVRFFGAHDNLLRQTPRGFNGRGELVFGLSFTNNTHGIFIADAGGPPPPPRSRIGYRIRVPRQAEDGSLLVRELPRPWAITIDDLSLDDDARDDPENHVIGRALGLLNVATSDAEIPGGSDGDDRHHVRYALRPARHGVADANGPRLARPEKSVLRTWILANALGSIHVRTAGPTVLLVPAVLGSDSLGGPPAGAPHYVCRKVSTTPEVTDQTPDAGRGRGRFRGDLQIFASDTFGDCSLDRSGGVSFAGAGVAGMCLFDVSRPKELCNVAAIRPVEPPRATTAEFEASIADAASSLLCYQVKLAAQFRSESAASLAGGVAGERILPKQSVHVQRRMRDGTSLQVSLANGMPAPEMVDTVRHDVVCIPTEVLAVEAEPS